MIMMIVGMFVVMMVVIARMLTSTTWWNWWLVTRANPLVSHNLDKWHCSENKEKNKGTFPQTSRVFCQMRW